MRKKLTKTKSQFPGGGVVFISVCQIIFLLSFSRKKNAFIKGQYTPFIAAVSKNIKFIENPTDEKLFELYMKCYSVIFTALNEDWGMVILEAMACGKPIIASNSG